MFRKYWKKDEPFPLGWVCAHIEKVTYLKDGFGENIPAIQINFYLLDEFTLNWEDDDCHLVISIRLSPDFDPKTQLFNIIDKLHGVEKVMEHEIAVDAAISVLNEQYVFVLFGKKSSGYPFVKDIINLFEVNQNYHSLDRSIKDLIEGPKCVNCKVPTPSFWDYPCQLNCLIYNAQAINGKYGWILLSTEASEDIFPSGWYRACIYDTFIIEKPFESYDSAVQLNLRIGRHGSSKIKINEIALIFTPIAKYRNLIDRIIELSSDERMIGVLPELNKSPDNVVDRLDSLKGAPLAKDFFIQFMYNEGKLIVQEVMSPDGFNNRRTDGKICLNRKEAGH